MIQSRISRCVMVVVILFATACDDFNPRPTISSFSPASGAIGSTVVISGTNFSATPADNIVMFNGTATIVSSSTSTSLTVTVPVTATTGAISVTVNKLTATSSSSFIVTTTENCASEATQLGKVVCLANAFLATLTASQLASVIVPYNLDNAKRWSDLPCGLSCRNGLLFSDMTPVQQAAALSLIERASGSISNEGYEEWQAIRAADDYLGTISNGYGSGNYVIAFLGTPSTTSKWMLQFGGHHYAQNITYDKGGVQSITPMHEGVDPPGSFTINGATYASPMASELAAMRNLMGSLTSTELASAKITSTFSNCLMVPGSTTNTFPSTKQGIKVSALSASVQAKIMSAIAAWVNDVDPLTATFYQAIYQNELANTYLAYAGNANATAGNGGSFFTTNTDYVRIDGPSVWIEFVCQGSTVVSSQVQYQTVMRDHVRDYIGL